MPRNIDLSARRLAFPDGHYEKPGLEGFAGDSDQLFSMASAVTIRQAMEDFHGGLGADADARVVWPGGSCRYAEAARISPRAVGIFAAASNAKIANDLSMRNKALRGYAPEAAANVVRSMLMASKWYLPEANDAGVEDVAEGIMSGLRPNALRQEARTPKVAKSALSRRGFIAGFLSDYATGNPSPDEAARQGADVRVVAADGASRPWTAVGHIGDRDMMRFNVGLSDEIYTTALGVEEAAFRLPSRRERSSQR